MSSPYERVLGDELDRLHPRLRTYFGAIPAGAVGEGHGVFDVVGVRRRMLRPLLAPLRTAAILAPVRERGVPFRVRNAPRRGAVVAARTLELASRTWTMVDRIGVVRGLLVDDLGIRARLRAEFDARVVDGRLELRSTRVLVRIGVVRVPIPHAIAPRVTLVERFDDARDRQHVSVELALPLVGVVYEYAGSFDYAITEGERG